MKQFVIDRMKERSTWAGLTAVLTAAGVALSPELAEAIIAAGVAIGGLLFTVTKG